MIPPKNTTQQSISPLVWVLLAAFFVRFIAAIFSKGYLTHDDHFIPIETAYQWLSGQTEFFADKSGAWRNQLYTILHYSILAFLDALSLKDPQQQMFIVRFLHALYSMLAIVFSYKITYYLTHKQKDALLVAILLSFFWVLPVFSVHSFVETACIPPLLIAMYYSHKIESEAYNQRYLLLASFFFALAFTLRFQTFIFGIGVGFVLLYQKQFKKAFTLLGYTCISLFITMGILDWIVYGFPFASIIQYSLFNIANRFEYIVAPWYSYLALLLVAFIFPTSLIFAGGIMKIAKKYSLSILSLLLFILLHSIFANKQERFILPVVPFLIIFGVMGWQEWKRAAGEEKFAPKKLDYKKFKNILFKIAWIWFWLINSFLLTISLFYYSKEPLVETFYYLNSKKDINAIAIENNKAEIPHLPLYYLYQNKPVYRLESPETSPYSGSLDSGSPYSGSLDSGSPYSGSPDSILYSSSTVDGQKLAEQMQRIKKTFNAIFFLQQEIKITPKKQRTLIKKPAPNYFILLSDERLTSRVRKLEETFQIKLQKEATIQVDSFLTMKFPQLLKNSSQKIIIYKKQ